MDKFLLKRKAPSQEVPEDMNWEEEIQYDPGKRKLIEHYHPNLKDLVRRKYLLNGPCQPKDIDFPYSDFGAKKRRFNPEWYADHESWLEYSEEKKKAYCFCCFLFRDRSHKKEAGYEAFVLNGWNTWSVPARLKDHVGEPGSVHDQAMKKCTALLKRDQHIDVAIQVVNAMKCVKSTRIVLNELREDGWESLLGEVHVFCEEHDIVELDMEEACVNPKKRRQVTGITNKHNYQVDCFNAVFDWLVQELDSRFSETSSNLLVWSAALSPRDSFRDFNLENLMSLAKLYPQDFDSGDLRDLDKDLRLYIADVRTDDSFSNIATITELSKKMVQTRRHIMYPLFYRLLKLVIVLPIATATVERCFSAMKLVKTCLRNRLNDDSLSDDVICYVEKEEMKKVTNDQVVEYFMALRKRVY